MQPCSEVRITINDGDQETNEDLCTNVRPCKLFGRTCAVLVEKIVFICMITAIASKIIEDISHHRTMEQKVDLTCKLINIFRLSVIYVLYTRMQRHQKID